MRHVVPKISVGRVPVRALGRRQPTVVRDGVSLQAAPSSAERMLHLVLGPRARTDRRWSIVINETLLRSRPTYAERSTYVEDELDNPIEGAGGEGSVFPRMLRLEPDGTFTPVRVARRPSEELFTRSPTSGDLY